MDLGYPILIIEKFPRIGPKIHAVNKASEGDGIPAELFQILKDDAQLEFHHIH